MLNYKIEKNMSINRWLVSPVQESYFFSEEKVMNGNINQGAGFIVTEYPCRTQFLEEMRIKRVEFDDSKKYSYALYVPFENKKVEFSRFNHTPTYLNFFAKGFVESENEKIIKLKIGTTGGVKIWVNGIEEVLYTPYSRNHVTYEIIELKLRVGLNEIVIYCDDLAERDINYYFEVISLEELEWKINSHYLQERIDYIEELLKNAYFSKDCYCDEEVVLNLGKEIKERVSVKYTMISGDPVNELRDLSGKVEIEKFQTEVKLFNTNEKPIGFYKVFVTLNIGGVEATKMLTLENFNTINAPILENIENRKRYALKHIAKYGDDTLDKTLAIIETEGFTYEAQRNFEVEISKIEKNYDCSDFSLFSLIHMYKNQDTFLPNVIKARIKKALLNFRYWIDEPGNDCMWYFSENHALCLHGGQFLAGELFKDNIFKSGKIGEENRKIGKYRLKKWFEDFFKRGLGEWNSVTYIPIDLIAMFGLYGLTEDKEIKSLAKKSLDYIFTILAENFHSGITSSSYGRVYEKELKGQLTNECSFLNWIAFGEGYLNNKLRASTLMSLSSYTISKNILDKLELDNGEKLILRVQGDEKVKLYSYKKENYSLSSAINYRSGKEGHQESLIHLNIKNCIKNQIWISHPGEEVPSGEGRPSFWAGNGRLPNIIQEKNMLFMEYEIQKEDRVKFTHMYCDSKFYDIVEKIDDKTLYLKKDKVNILVKTKESLFLMKNGPTKDREFRSLGVKNYWLVYVDDKKEYNEFKEMIHSIGVVQKNQKNYILSLNSSKLDVQFSKESILINGEEYLNRWN
ncbi:MAG: hypothetical protein ACRC8M_00955 [Cetobacterium sp.]|uniref:hypothetical protein n=1 Tax=Cetobacterium sp. TaxID=2071632 RepID=UPI003F3978FD